MATQSDLHLHLKEPLLFLGISVLKVVVVVAYYICKTKQDLHLVIYNRIAIVMTTRC